MGPSRYDHLIFTFQPARRIGLRRGCDDLNRPSGGTLTREKPLSRLLFSEQHGTSIEIVTAACIFHNPLPESTWRGSTQESFRVISTARLRTSPPVHLPPIHIVVCNDPKWRSHLEVGFVLRCFQHLSVPDAATRPCPWRDNRLAGGRSNTVLSY